MMTLADAYAILQSGTLWSSTGKCKGYAIQNPGEAKQIDAYVASLNKGQIVAPPALATATGKGLVNMLAALAVAPTPPAPTPPPNYLFHDTFDGPAGSAPDPTKWVNLDGIDLGVGSFGKAANAFLDGQGSLVLRISREPWHGSPFAGAFLGSYQYQTGWPPSPIKAAFPVPFRYEVSFIEPDVDGAWISPGWLQNVDKTTAQGIVEIDLAECSTSKPTWIGANQHKWQLVNGTVQDVLAENGGTNATDARHNWHLVAAEVRDTETKYFLDGALMATHSGANGKFGTYLQAAIAPAGSWASGGKQPNPDDPGPWDMKIGGVSVFAL